MSAWISIPARALVRAAWQEGINRGWRFSPARSRLWILLAEIGFAALLLWRLGGQVPAAEAGSVILLAAAQAALYSFMTLFLRGRLKLYGGPLVQLIHLSPTPAQAAIAAEVLSLLPRRAWTATLFTAAILPALPGAARLWAVPALWLVIILGGLLGHMAGLLALMAWVRMAPQSLGSIWILSMVATLAFAYYFIYLLIAGVSLAGLAAAMQRARRWLPVGFGLLFGLPGLLMLLRLLRSPRTAGEVYREGWLGLMELGDAASRPRRSRFPRIAPGAAGAIQALVWLISLRNWMSGLRLGLWAAGTGALVLAGPLLSRQPEPRLTLFVLGLGLGMGLLNYGEQAAALFSADGPRATLFALTGVRPHQLLMGKWLAASPLALVAAVSAGVTALAAHQPLDYALAATALSLLIGTGSLTWLIGAAAFDARPMDSGFDAESEQLAAALEQVPTRPGGMVGLVGAVAVAAAGVWLFTVQPLLLCLLALLPLAALAAGYFRLRDLLHNGLDR